MREPSDQWLARREGAQEKVQRQALMSHEAPVFPVAPAAVAPTVKAVLRGGGAGSPLDKQRWRDLECKGERETGGKRMPKHECGEAGHKRGGMPGRRPFVRQRHVREEACQE